MSDAQPQERQRKRHFVWAALVAVWSDISDKSMSLVAAGVAFFGMLSIFPALAAMIAIWGWISDPAELQAQLVFVERFVPEQVFAVINTQVTALIRAQDGALGLAGLISLFFALWSARAGVSALMQGLNLIYDATPRSALWHYVDALAMTLVLVSVALVALACIVVAPLILAVFPFAFSTALIIDALRWIAAISVVLIALGILYRYGPNRPHIGSIWRTPGAIMTLFVWVAASAGFSIYLSRFGNYNEVYGSIGAVIALLMWFYISAFLVLVGASLNAHLDRLKTS